MFASDVAALIGKSPYTTPDEIKVKMWKASDRRLFDRCMALAKGAARRRLETDETRALQALAKIDETRKSQTMVALGKVARESAPCDLAVAVKRMVSSDVLLDAMAPTAKKQKLVEVDHQCKQAVNAAIAAAVKEVATPGVAATVVNSILRTKTPTKAKEALLEQGVSAAASERMVAEVQRRASAAIVKTVAVPSIDESIRSAVKNVATAATTKAALMVAVANEPSASRHVTKAINTGIGVALETTSIDRFQKQSGRTVHERNYQPYSKTLAYEFGTFVLYGRLDGLQGDDTVVEAKQRANRLFRRLIQRERVQLMVYIHLTGRTKGTLVETYKNEQQSYSINQNHDEWAKIELAIRAELEDLYRILYVGDDAARIALIQTTYK